MKMSSMNLLFVSFKLKVKTENIQTIYMLLKKQTWSPSLLPKKICLFFKTMSGIFGKFVFIVTPITFIKNLSLRINQ